MLDYRHQPPVLSDRLSIDWSNPLWYWFLGVAVTVTAAVLLAFL